MSANEPRFPVTVMSRVLGVSPSGYYAWRTRRPSSRHQRRCALAGAVAAAHQASHGVYGYRKVHEDVSAHHPCCPETVRRVMRATGLRARRKRRFAVTTDSRHRLPVAPNRLKRAFHAWEPNRKWVADITYISTRQGWVYLAAVMDLYSRRIVGWATSRTNDAALACQALHQALRARRPQGALLLHSDQGCQYASDAYQRLLGLHRITCSMSRRGNCWDNACMERFFASLKTEWLGDTLFEGLSHAHSAIFEYIETFYNTTRRHAALEYLTPAHYEARATAVHGKNAAQTPNPTVHIS